VIGAMPSDRQNLAWFNPLARQRANAARACASRFDPRRRLIAPLFALLGTCTKNRVFPRE
jgi:hypothetical protein